MQLYVHAQVVGDLRDRRARSKPIQRHRIGVELGRIVLVHHDVSGLLISRTVKFPDSSVQDQGATTTDGCEKYLPRGVTDIGLILTLQLFGWHSPGGDLPKRQS
ncbi:hypothetical protein [Actinoplanes subtropicus]|uniref:hypothetical protein n=1 Tax=Actinoplanes subtropicus TaxID=543632 RepID=UPI001B80BFE7